MMAIGGGCIVVGSLALSFPALGATGLILLIPALLHDCSVAHRAAQDVDT
jgi:hypothetical protein